MFHIDNNSGIPVMPPVRSKFSDIPLFFTEGGNGVPPSWPGADWFNIVQSEILHVLVSAGIAPDKVDHTQLKKAMSTLFMSRINPGMDLKEDGTAMTFLDNLGLADPNGAVLYPELQMARWRDEGDVRAWGMKPEAGFDNTPLLASAIASGQRMFKFQPGTYMFSYIYIDSVNDISLLGAPGYATEFQQIVGSNRDFITMLNMHRGTRLNIRANGNWLLSEWNANPGILGNTTGNGLVVKGRGFYIDMQIHNIAGIGAWFQNPGLEDSSRMDPLHIVFIEGKDFGKEGIVYQGPGDGILKKAWIGRPGLLPRPAAHSQIAMSDIYVGSPVDGVVIDGTTIEIGELHVYACWSGTGFRTRNNVRLTKGGRVISESSRSQAYISQGTYGSLFLDTRNQSLLHPNWTAAIPAYTGTDTTGMPEFDMVTIDGDYGLEVELTVRKMKLSGPYVHGSKGLVVNGSCSTTMVFANSMAETGDEGGYYYSGDAALYTCDHGGHHRLTAQNVRGIAANVTGAGMRIDLDVLNAETGLRRLSATNSKRGNNITGALFRCGTSFTSVGQPAAENINLSIEQIKGQIPFTGDKPDMSRAQNWNISASVNNVSYSTFRRASTDLDASTTAARVVQVAHRFLYQPEMVQVQLTVDDRSSITTARREYCDVTAIDDTYVTIAYKFSNADTTAAANLRVNLMIQ